MLFRAGGGAGAAMVAARTLLVRHFSRKRALDVRKINPKVSDEEAKEISRHLYSLVDRKGALTANNVWDHAKDGGVNGLASKTHMKIMLNWMLGKRMLKRFCIANGSTKTFRYATKQKDIHSAKAAAASKSEATEPAKLGKTKTKMAIKHKRLLNE